MNLLKKMCKDELLPGIVEYSYKNIGVDIIDRNMCSALRELVNDCGEDILLSHIVIASQVYSMFRYVRDIGQFVMIRAHNNSTSLYKCNGVSLTYYMINDQIKDHIVTINDHTRSGDIIQKECKLIDILNDCRHLLGTTIKDLFPLRHINSIMANRYQIGQDPDNHFDPGTIITSMFGPNNAEKILRHIKMVLNGEIITLVIDTDSPNNVFKYLSPILHGLFGSEAYIIKNGDKPYGYNYLLSELEAKYKFTIDYEDEYGPLGIIMCSATALKKSAIINSSCSIVSSIIVRKEKTASTWQPFPKYVNGDFDYRRKIKYTKIKCVSMPDNVTSPREHIGDSYTTEEIYGLLNTLYTIDTDLEDYRSRRTIAGE